MRGLDPETHPLPASLTRSDDHGMDAPAQTEIAERRWAFMAGIRETDVEFVRDKGAPVLPERRMERSNLESGWFRLDLTDFRRRAASGSGLPDVSPTVGASASGTGR